MTGRLIRTSRASRHLMEGLSDIGLGLMRPVSGAYRRSLYRQLWGQRAPVFFKYQNALPGHPLYEKARTGTNIAVSGTLFDVLREDVRQNKLPQISWIVAPEAFSEHGNWPANYGAWYVSQVLDTLTSNPEVWSKTVLIVTYDENDGFFDHLVPPTPPRSPAEGRSTVDVSNEIFPGSPGNPSGPYGLGVRVPTILVSPWSKGGWVCSEVFDHTSLIRFIERRFGPSHPGLIETNITAWRRTVCGDLTSAFDFATPHVAPAALPDTAAYAPPDHLRHPDYVPVPPTDQALPSQERGLRHARAIPYELHATGTADSANNAFRIDFANTGQAGACFQVRSGNASDGPMDLHGGGWPVAVRLVGCGAKQSGQIRSFRLRTERFSAQLPWQRFLPRQSQSRHRLQIRHRRARSGIGHH